MSALPFLLSSFLLQFVRVQAVSKGCSINNASVVVPANTTVADDTWWYTCNGDSWLAKGCVVNGQRYNVGEQFFGYLSEFYGRCEALEGKYIRATVLGCIDVNNHTVEPGHVYLADPLFWANCTSTSQLVTAEDLGNITLDIIGRRIIGCNDGTDEIVPDDGTFVQVSHDGPLLAGVGLICKIRGYFPQVQPEVCVVANNSETDEAYIGLTDHCYGRLHRFVFYCTIAGEEDPKNGTAIYGWEIGWNVSSKQFISSLKTNGYRDCINQANNKPHPSKDKLTESSSRLRRFKRNGDNLNSQGSYDQGAISAVRIPRRAQWNTIPELLAYSKFITVKKPQKIIH